MAPLVRYRTRHVQATAGRSPPPGQSPSDVTETEKLLRRGPTSIPVQLHAELPLRAPHAENACVAPSRGVGTPRKRQLNPQAPAAARALPVPARLAPRSSEC